MTEPILLPDRADMPLASNSLLRWSWYFIGPYKKIILPFLGYRVFRYIWFALFPAMVGYAIDAIDSGAAKDDPWRYVWIISGFTGVMWAMLMANFVFLKESLAYERASRGLTMLGIQHLMRLPLDWYEKQGSGGNLQKVMNARRAFLESCRIMRWTIIPVLGTMIGAIISIVGLDAPLYYIPIYLGMVFSYLYLSWLVGKKLPMLYDKHNERMENLLSGVYEFVTAIRTVKSFSIHHYIDEKSRTLENEGLAAVANVFKISLLRWSIINLVAFGWIIFIILLGFHAAVTGTLQTGAYAATVFLSASLWTTMEDLAKLQDNMFEYASGLRRFTETLKIKPAELDIAPILPLPEWTSLTFQNLTYVYNEKDGHGIQGVSFDVKRGQKVAFVGSSGAGKTTLAKLLMKQMLPHEGGIFADDIDLKHVESEEWLSQIGFVPQDVELFNLSIRDNILIDRDNIDEDFYQTVLKQSALDEFIVSLPEGDLTVIGERGIKLSGGQRQRLGIARALIRNTPIIVFDEATSSLDSLSEQQIQQAIEQSFASRTVFLIAHRLSTVRQADVIVVLDRGRIVECGSFTELVNRPNGHFAKMWNAQTNIAT